MKSKEKSLNLLKEDISSTVYLPFFRIFATYGAIRIAISI